MIGEKWLPCVPYLQVLCVGMIFWPLSNVNLNLLYVKGRTDCVLKLDLMKKPIAFAFLFCAIPFGIFWMCVSRCFYNFVAFSFNCYYTRKILGYGLWAQLKDIALIVLNSLVMVIAVHFAMIMVDSKYAQLSIGTFVGVAVYFCAAAFTRDASLRELGAFVIARLKVLK